MAEPKTRLKGGDAASLVAAIPDDARRNDCEGDWCENGFAARKSSLTLYTTPGLQSYQERLAKLGVYRTGVSHLYIRRLADGDSDVLSELVEQSVGHVREHGFAPADAN